MVIAQTVWGQLLDATVMGVIFARISYPKQRARTIFISDSAVVARRDGLLKFMVRLGDIRKTSVGLLTISFSEVHWSFNHEAVCLDSICRWHSQESVHDRWSRGVIAYVSIYIPLLWQLTCYVQNLILQTEIRLDWQAEFLSEALLMPECLWFIRWTDCNVKTVLIDMCFRQFFWTRLPLQKHFPELAMHA